MIGSYFQKISAFSQQPRGIARLSVMPEKSNLSVVTKYQLKNSLAVKEGVALFEMASVEKVVKSKGAAKKWL